MSQNDIFIQGPVNVQGGRPIRIIGLMTEDFSLYYDLVKMLKDGNIPFVSLSVGQSIPRTVGAIITSEEESPRILFKNKIAVPEGADLDAVINEAKRIMSGTDLYNVVVIGIDPGPRPGLAVLADGTIVFTEQLATPEKAAHRIFELRSLYPAREFLIRIGHGDTTKRNRIINSLTELGVPIEIVDEKGTTETTDRPDIHAAINISRTPGNRVIPPLKIEPTEGELRDIKRRSRIKSDGRFTISQELAELVARGDITLDQAVEAQASRQSMKKKER